jgi:hypothetical protein
LVYALCSMAPFPVKALSCICFIRKTKELEQLRKLPKQVSLEIKLTSRGLTIAEKMWEEVPGTFKEVTLKIEDNIFPLYPKTIRERVNRDYPE